MTIAIGAVVVVAWSCIWEVAPLPGRVFMIGLSVGSTAASVAHIVEWGR